MTKSSVLTVPDRPPPRPSAPPKRRWWLRVFGALIALGLTAGFVCEFIHVTMGSNWHTVIAGRVYRCGQLLPEELEEAVARHGIRTVINLRGCCYPQDWYVQECKATHRSKVAQEDLTFSANRYPSKVELRRLVEVLDNADYPVLLHCRQGADRTGMASALVMLLQNGIGYGQARGELGPRFGHLPLTRTIDLDEFFSYYETWLRSEERQHSPANLRRWLSQGYCENHWNVGFEEAPDDVLYVRRGEPWAMHFRLRNQGTMPWRLAPTLNAGIHLGFVVISRDGALMAAGRAGLFEAQVFPGQTVHLTASVPAIARPGTYRMVIDMVDERHGWFYQMGAEPLEREVRVSE
jgi:protein tyrosine phosphatase (PTP) superfamily phosphohydrolase (DUF442 family)